LDNASATKFESSPYGPPAKGCSERTPHHCGKWKSNVKSTRPVGGDPLYQFPVFGWLVYQRAVNPLHVSYGVDEVRKIVYVKSVRPFPGGGLESVP
jgi:hypothetical protein